MPCIGRETWLTSYMIFMYEYKMNWTCVVEIFMIVEFKIPMDPLTIVLWCLKWHKLWEAIFNILVYYILYNRNGNLGTAFKSLFGLLMDYNSSFKATIPDIDKWSCSLLKLWVFCRVIYDIREQKLVRSWLTIDGLIWLLLPS